MASSNSPTKNSWSESGPAQNGRNKNFEKKVEKNDTEKLREDFKEFVRTSREEVENIKKEAIKHIDRMHGWVIGIAVVVAIAFCAMVLEFFYWNGGVIYEQNQKVQELQQKITNLELKLAVQQVQGLTAFKKCLAQNSLEYCLIRD